jgi:protoheme IX farnesyltransferase
LLYSTALIPVSLLPTLLAMSGRLYFAGALVLGIVLLYFGWRLASLKVATSNARSKQRARQLLQATVIYLPLLFALMMLNKR